MSYKSEAFLTIETADRWYEVQKNSNSAEILILFKICNLSLQKKSFESEAQKENYWDILGCPDSFFRFIRW